MIITRITIIADTIITRMIMITTITIIHMIITIMRTRVTATSLLLLISVSGFRAARAASRWRARSGTQAASRRPRS